MSDSAMDQIAEELREMREENARFQAEVRSKINDLTILLNARLNRVDRRLKAVEDSGDEP